MRIAIHPKYQNQEEAILQLVKIFFEEGDLIMKGSRNIIKSNLLGNEKVNIKFLRH